MSGFTDWQSFAAVVEKNPTNGYNWTDSHIDNISLVMESAIGDVPLYESLVPTGDGASTDWEDYTDGGAASYGDFDVRNHTWFLQQWLSRRRGDTGSTADWPNAMATETVDDAQSFTFLGTTQTFNTVSSLKLVFYLERIGIPPTALVEVFFRPTSGSTANEQVIQVRNWPDDDLSNTLALDGTYTFSAYSEENPYTEAAWTTAQMAAGEFGVRFLGGPKLVIGSVRMQLTGLGPDASSGLQVDQVLMDVVGSNADEALDLGIIGKTRLWSTSQAHLRLTAPKDIDDVTNSVAVTTPGTVPLDWDILFGQVYLVNGTDKTRRYPNASDVYEELTNNGSNYITGRTVAAFADRIVYGWVNDNGTKTPERVAYSKIYDGGDHDHDSAGDFDLMDTPGGVIKLATLTEDICAAYKEEGIYALRRTGIDAAPIIRDVVDRQTGCLAPQTVKTLVDMNGRPFQMFLGYNPSNGVNVYMFDGTKVSPVWGVHKSLRDDTNEQALSRAFAEVEPQEGMYWLFVAQGTDDVPDTGYVYHVRSGQWTQFELPFPVSCAGQWTMDYRFEGKTIGVPGFKKHMILGGMDGLPRIVDYDVSYDELFPYGTESVETNDYIYAPMANPGDQYSQGMFAETITSTLETGDYRLVSDGNPEFQALLNRIHIMYKDAGPFTVGVSVSVDGGVTYSTVKYYSLGGADPDKWGRYLYEVMDLDSTSEMSGRRHRIKFSFAPQYDGLGERLDLKELWLEYEDAPVNA